MRKFSYMKNARSSYETLKSECGRILPDTVAVLSLGLLIEEFCFSYIWNPGKSPILRNGNTTVRCQTMFLLFALVFLLKLAMSPKPRVTDSNGNKLVPRTSRQNYASQRSRMLARLARTKGGAGRRGCADSSAASLAAPT